MRGSVFKRCSCPIERDTKGRRKACRFNHGSWAYVVDLGPGPGKDGQWQPRRQAKQSGFATKAEAETELAKVTATVSDGSYAHDQQQTVATYLTAWLEQKRINGLRPTTLQGYSQHIADYLAPYLGHLRLKDLHPGHVEQLLNTLLSEHPVRGKKRPAMSAATVRRVHATLRSALAAAKKKRLISFNPAIDVELPAHRRPKAQPWEPAELGAFLDHVATDRFGTLFEVIATVGLRRGEAIGLRWADVDLERGVIYVRQQIVQAKTTDPCKDCGVCHGWFLVAPTKTFSHEEEALDIADTTVGALMAQRLTQDAEKAAWGDAYQDHGLVFAREDGTPYSPGSITTRFAQLVETSGLRKVRLHDLRHGNASLMLAAGVDIAIVSKRLRHSSIAITADTYSHLLEGVGKDAAERSTGLIPRSSRDQSVTNQPENDSGEASQNDVSPGQKSGPRGARTHDLRIKSPELYQLS